MKNNKGFTLVELLASITILIVIATIALPSIITMRDKTNENGLKKVKNLLYESAETYIYTYNFDIDNAANSGQCIQIKELLEKQMLKNTEELVNNKDKFVKLSKKDGKIEYEVVNSCSDVLKYEEEKEEPEEVEDNKNEAGEYIDGSGANPPLLASGMIPVKYNGTNWVVADTSQKWYDYNNKEWANAVTTNSATYRTARAGTVIPMSAINSMWVWIPRYKYRITFQTIGIKNFGGSANPYVGFIDVVFEKGTATTGNDYKTYGVIKDKVLDNRNISTLAINEYYTHPAFRDGTTAKKSSTYDIGGWDKELTGIWIGKFETGGTADEPLIKPSINSLPKQTLAKQFETALKISNGTVSGTYNANFSTNSSNTYGLNTTSNTTNTHMTKNTEWGAVAYLYQSKYGKANNREISTNERENESTDIYPNYSIGQKSTTTADWNNYPPKTGYSSSRSNCSTYCAFLESGTIGSCGGGGGSNSNCLLGDATSQYNTTIGVEASTTGNVYGVYDMNGGLGERVMGGSFSCYTKYCDYYKYYNGNMSEISFLGDATWETRNWYKASYVESLSSNSSLVRGFYPGDANRIIELNSQGRDVVHSGIFAFDQDDNTAKNYVGFRVTLIP